MITVKSVDEYEKSDGLLIIYGAGIRGRRLLNEKNFVPNYFCDRKAAEIGEVVSDDGSVTVPCISIQQLAVRI